MSFRAPVQHRRGGLIHIKPRTVGHQPPGHVVDHRGDQRARPVHPVGQHRALDRHPMPRHDHSLPVQRHVLGMLGDGNLRQQRLSRLAELGCTEFEIMAITGHQTSKEVTRHTKAASHRTSAEAAFKKMGVEQKWDKSVPLFFHRLSQWDGFLG